MAAFVAGSVLAGGLAYAAIPTSTTGQIVACYQVKGGALRVIDAASVKKCAVGEAKLTWGSQTLRWRGAWKASTSYTKDDVVSSGGGSYLATAASLNVAVTNSSVWVLLAARGAEGSAGPQGIAGPQGVDGPQGRAGASGPAYGRQIVGTRVIDALGTQYSSVAIGFDGNPVVAYKAAGNRLGVAVCSDPVCTATPTTRLLDAVGLTAHGTSITIGADGNPVISYWDVTNANLKIAVCIDPACALPPAVSVLDSTPNLASGRTTSVTIDVAGNPIVAYYAWENSLNRTLRLAMCLDATCSAHQIVDLVVADDTTQNLVMASVTIGASGEPIVAYYARKDPPSSDGALRIVICGDPSCSTHQVRMLDADGDVGKFASVVVNGEGNPMVAYLDSSLMDLKMVACGDPSCSAVNPPTVLDADGDVGADASLAIGADGLPQVAYRDAVGQITGAIKLAVCTDTTCSASPVVSVLVAADVGGPGLSLVIGESGRPVISYFHRPATLSDWRLKLAVVSRTGWAPNDWGG